MGKDTKKDRNTTTKPGRTLTETTSHITVAVTQDILNIIAYGATAENTPYQIEQANRLLTASRLLSKTINKATAAKLFVEHTGLSLDMARRYVAAAEEFLGEVQPVKKNALREMLVQKHMGIYRQAIIKYQKNETDHPNIAIKYLETAQRAIEAIGKLFDMRENKTTPADADLQLPTILLAPQLPPDA